MPQANTEGDINHVKFDVAFVQVLCERLLLRGGNKESTNVENKQIVLLKMDFHSTDLKYVCAKTKFHQSKNKIVAN